jgi:hypothetical protein
MKNDPQRWEDVFGFGVLLPLIAVLIVGGLMMLFL